MNRTVTHLKALKLRVEVCQSAIVLNELLVVDYVFEWK